MLSGLSIVVPVYDEEATLRAVVESLVALVPGLAARWEILIVNDGSRDGSLAIARELASEYSQVRWIDHGKNRGFGASQRTGIAAAQEEFLTVVPSDGQFDVEDLRPMAAAIERCDIVLGVRGQRGDGWYRTLKTRVFRWVVRGWLDIPFADINWVKMYRREIFERIEITSDNIGVEAEIVLKARALGFRFEQVPVGYLPRTAGEAKGDQVRNVLITIRELIRLRGWSLRSPRQQAVCRATN